MRTASLSQTKSMAGRVKTTQRTTCLLRARGVRAHFRVRKAYNAICDPFLGLLFSPEVMHVMSHYRDFKRTSGAKVPGKGHYAH
jgi:hypothetical protein